ncbi:MAG: archaeosortase/exosortase family protein [Kiritimatiellia bacterium]
MLKKVVIFAAIFLFGVWLTVHWGRVTGDADAVIRFSLGLLFAVLIMLRRKKPEDVRVNIPDAVFPVFLAAGTIGALLGIIFRVNMLEWAGVLMLLAACFLWVIPRHHRSDFLLAFLVIFWVHPLPGQVFGWMQGGMQRLSVMGSEVILHTLNVRVWGDGIILRTGYQNFLVPDVCSGMRTSVTVFLCALGVGLLLKLKWYETLFFIVLGLAQVLALNITRISFMVGWAPRMPPAWAENFLHDTLGVFLMIGVALIQFEAGVWCWWSRRRAFIKEGIRRKEIEPKEQASIIPHPLRRLMFASVILAGVALVGFGTFMVFYKSRAFHRKEMIREVAEGLLETDAVSAERAVREALRLFPDDLALMRLHANAMVQLGRFPDGLQILDTITAAGHSLTLEDTILKSWALSREGRLGEARGLIEGLGAAQERIPGVAMLKAEFAAMDGVPSAVSRYIVFASQSRALLPRIRALFPYLAGHEQWAAIAAADHDAPYREFYEALIALHANQQVDNLSGLMRTMRQTLTAWPLDPRLMGPLFEIAVRRQGGEWEQYFEENLRANLRQLHADALAAAADYCWRLGRPELAWLVYLHLERVSSNDPALLIAPVQFAPGWTEFRRRSLGVPSEDAARTINIRPVLDYLQLLVPVADIRAAIPQYAVVTRQAMTSGVQQRMLEASLAELARRESTGVLRVRMARLYPIVLAQLGRYEEAHARLDRMLVDFPELRADIFMQHAGFYTDQQRWADAYEALQSYRSEVGMRSLTGALLEISALMNMNMAVGAMERLAQAREIFPGTVRLDLADSAIWDVFGFKYQALHALRRTRAGARSAAAVDLLEQTYRHEDAQRLRSSLDLPRRRAILEMPMFLPAADLALTPRWPAPPDRLEVDAELAQLRQQRDDSAISSFVSGLRSLQIAWFEVVQQDGYENVSADQIDAIIGEWEAVGRSVEERAVAIYQLAMYTARQRDYALAVAALARAAELLPANAAIWRARLALEGRESPALVDAALAACPADSEVFLAALVSRVDRLEGDAARAAIAEMAAHATQEDDLFPVETLVRAGTYLLALGWREEVLPFARAVEARAESLLSAHVFVMRCAMMNNDGDRAIGATLRAINLAVDKVPFYRALVDLKIIRRELDTDLLQALEYLQRRQPEDPRWSEALGTLYFERGDLRRALAIFGSVIDEDIRGVQVRTLLLAAEAARLENRIDRAVRILESAHALQPEQPQILNNLVYLLAQRVETLGRARELLPRLLEIGGESFQVLDTASVVAMRAGDLEQAEKWMEQAIDLLNMDEYAAHEVRLNLAELKIRQGRWDAARSELQVLRQDASRPDYVDQRARLLMRDLDAGGIR